jgi:hypothetical protein
MSRASIGVATVVALAADLPSAAVRDTAALGMPSARPLAFPVPGRLLVEAPPFGLAIIEHDGRMVRLGTGTTRHGRRMARAWPPRTAGPWPRLTRWARCAGPTGDRRARRRRSQIGRLTGGALPTAAASPCASSLMMAVAITPWPTGSGSPVPGGVRVRLGSSRGRIATAPPCRRCRGSTDPLDFASRTACAPGRSAMVGRRHHARRDLRKHRPDLRRQARSTSAPSANVAAQPLPVRSLRRRPTCPRPPRLQAWNESRHACPGARSARR